MNEINSYEDIEKVWIRKNTKEYIDKYSCSEFKKKRQG